MTGSDSLNQGSESELGPEADIQTEGSVAEDDPVVAGSSLDTKYTWAQCENPHCLKWRKITLEEEARLGEEPW